MTTGRTVRPTRLHELLALKVSGDIGYQAFCDDYEHAYNFEVGIEDLTPEEDRIFGELFDVVAWFTADESARSEAPAHFKDESAVEAAVQRAQRKLAELNRAKEATAKSTGTTPK